MDKPILEIVKDPNLLFIESHFEDEHWVAYPADDGDVDNAWWICRTTTKDDAEFIKNAIALHCSNFIYKE